MGCVPYNPDIQPLFCGWVPDLRDWHHADLSAPYWRFYWNSTEGAFVKTASGTTFLSPKNFYLISPNTSFAADLNRPVGHLYLHFTFGATHAGLAPNIFAFSAPNDLRTIAEELGELLLSESVGEGRVGLLAATLIHYGLSRIPAEYLPKSPRDERIAKAIGRLDDESAEPLDNEQLACLANMAPNAFIRLFRKTVGVSPQAYARRRRIDRACQLLHFSSQSIKEIAEACGFCDRYQFSKAFKKERRMGPAEYRRRMEPTKK